jgi:hypothetical protein
VIKNQMSTDRPDWRGKASYCQQILAPAFQSLSLDSVWNEWWRVSEAGERCELRRFLSETVMLWGDVVVEDSGGGGLHGRRDWVEVRCVIVSVPLANVTYGHKARQSQALLELITFVGRLIESRDEWYLHRADVPAHS